MTHREKMLEYARSHRDGFTTVEATRDLFITHIHRAVKELEADGHKFDRQEIKVDGTAKYYRYKLIPTQAQLEWEIFKKRCRGVNV